MLDDPRRLYLEQLSSNSRATMTRALDVAAELVGGRPWHELRYSDTYALRAKLLERYAPATCSKILAAVRRVLRECHRLGLIGADDYLRAIDLPRVRGYRVPPGRALSRRELARLFAACSPKSLRGVRNAALLALLYGAGLRRSEVVSLDVGDYGQGAVRVIGKGNKQRTVYLPKGARLAVDRYLELRGHEPGPLFHPVHHDSALIRRRRLSTHSVLAIVRELARRARVPRFSPHDCRRTFISDLLDAGVDIVTVQALAGHAQPSTTARYDRRGERSKQRAAGRLVVPYRGR